MSKKFGRSVLEQLQTIRYKLEGVQNCEDGEEMIAISLDIACDLEKVEEEIQTEFDI